ncbi:MAG TPA: diacylglycerol kinase family lipid kinase [Limnochordia bacterium]|jgi:diacylglycerol kinase (ATP)|nr:diacylglycerol kinase family lipid kinase [Limnochordia bacterium]HPT93964.1 diacylglycerol kinase family lipid kinase [Limnochordia bacterium]HQD70091.1 diacylglycerol kinase family lipid kinase [Limnochordia bacterium]
MSLAIIANPHAGRGRGQRVINTIAGIISERRLDCELLRTVGPGHAIELALKASQTHETIAVVGGDGTVNEVLRGMWQTKSTLAVIPGGTGNDCARGLGIPREPVAALEAVLTGKTARMDVIQEKDRLFGINSTIGFPSAVLVNVNNRRDSWVKGSAAFFAAVVQTIRELKSYIASIVVDETRLETDIAGVVLMNMPWGGGGLMFAPQARYDDGMISVVIIKSVGRWELMRALPSVYSGKHVNHPSVEILQGKKVVIETEVPLIKSFDGDLHGMTPYAAEIVPQAVSVVVGSGR